MSNKNPQRGWTQTGVLNQTQRISVYRIEQNGALNNGSQHTALYHPLTIPTFIDEPRMQS